MARPIWKGHISFGLVNIPVTLYSGEVRTELRFNLLDSRNKARVRYERVNEVTGDEVPWDKIVKAFDYDDGNYVLMQDEDFQQVKVESTQTVEIEDFVPEKAIDYIYFDKPYYLVPGKKGEKGYVLLRETLRRTKRVGIAKVVIRTRQHLAAVLPVGDALVLDILRFHQEVRAPGEFELPSRNPKDWGISDKEIKMAEQLVEAMTTDWKPEQYRDDYREALLEWIKKKADAEGEIAPPVPEEEGKPAGEIIDIMDLLKESVERRSGKGGNASGTRSGGTSKSKAKAKLKSKAKPKSKASPKSKAKAKAGARKKASGES